MKVGSRVSGLICALAIMGAMLACSLAAAPATEGASMPTIVAATLQALLTPTGAAATAAPASAPAPTQTSGTQVSLGNVSFIIPTGLASGASSESVPAVDAQSGGPWEVAPAFTRFTLQGYPLQGEFFEPQIMVYPAQAYASVNAGANLSLQRLQAILAAPAAPLTNNVLPRLPYANAEQIIGAQPKLLAFHGGQAVRVLAEYSQGYVGIDNHDLFFHFEGLTSDGKYYVVAVLPINASFLPATGDPSAAIPPGGVPVPANIGTGMEMQNYYQAVTDKLNGTTADAFQPTLTILDSLMESLQVAQ